MPSFGHLSVQIWIRPFSSPGTPSQSYGRFASKWLHLDTFLSRSGSGHFRNVRLLFWSNSICAKWTFLTTYRYAQMRSRSTPVGPNRRRRLKVLVLSTEINFEAFLEAISESGRRQKYPLAKLRTIQYATLQVPFKAKVKESINPSCDLLIVFKSHLEHFLRRSVWHISVCVKWTFWQPAFGPF